MHYRDYGKLSGTGQQQPIPGSSQVPNNAGGYSWQVDPITLLTRFLVLGTVGGSYYVGEHALTRTHLASLEQLLRDVRGREAIDLIVSVSQAGRATSNEPALFALARCAASDVYPVRRVMCKDGKERTYPDERDIATRRYALSKLPQVARTGSHLLSFMSLVKQFRGHGPALNRALRAWYNDRQPEPLAYQVLKYQQRSGYSQRDVLRIAKPVPPDSQHNDIYAYTTKGWEGEVVPVVPAERSLRQFWAYERIKRAEGGEMTVARLVAEYDLTREMVPTEHLRSPLVWTALLKAMPMEAMIKSLATMTRNGVFELDSSILPYVCSRLTDQELLKKSRLHPVKILAALLTYEQGHGERGKQSWTPKEELVSALDRAFYLAFANIVPTGKRTLVGVDTSGSMSHPVNGIPNLSCRRGASAMALLIAATEPDYHIIGFETHAQRLHIAPSQRLPEVLRYVERVTRPMGTDCALPFTYALQHGLVFDTVVSITDSETWAGNTHVATALDMYRARVGLPVKAINIQMEATGVSNYDPADRLSLEICGMDVTVPQAIHAFVTSDI